MRRRLTVLIAAAVAAVLVATSAALGGPTTWFTFTVNPGSGLHPTCTLTITSGKGISNYTVNGVKTEPNVETTSVTITVANGDVITVKAGTSTQTYTVTGCAPPHTGDDHDGDGDHDGDDHAVHGGPADDHH